MGFQLKSWFNQEPDWQDSEDQSNEPSLNSGLSYGRRAAELLEKVRKARCLLTVKIPGERQTFTSAILRVSAIDSYLLIDEVVPRQGNELLTAKQRIHLSAFLKGTNLEFESLVLSVGEENNVPIFKIDFPETVVSLQRRQYHRVRPPVGATVPVHCMVGSSRLVRGELQNISLGGLCFEVDKRQSRDLTVGEVIKRCVIEPTPGTKIVAAVEVRNASVPNPQSSLRRVGVKFLDLDKQAQNQLQQLVVDLERSELSALRRN